jgi:drug/metabolite transporter (DMT)-like permease
VNRAAARWRADLALTLVAIVWGATFVMVQQALHEISTMYFLALRFGLASALMAGLFLPAFQQMPAAALWRGLRGGAVAGGFLASGYALQTFGLKYTSAGNSGFLTGLNVVLVPVIGAAVFRRWPQARELLGVAVAVAGLATLTADFLSSVSIVAICSPSAAPWRSPRIYWYSAIFRSGNDLRR